MSDDGLVQISCAELDELKRNLRQAEVDAAYWKGRADALIEALKGASGRAGKSADQLVPFLVDAIKARKEKSAPRPDPAP